MLTNEGDRLTRVVVSTPRDAYFDVGTHGGANIPELADRERTIEQHDALKTTMADFGCEVIDLPELAADPNSVFTRDIALISDKSVLARSTRVLVDDSQENVASFLAAGGEACLFPQPWNGDPIPDEAAIAEVIAKVKRKLGR